MKKDGKSNNSWWERSWEGCELLYLKDIKPECLTDDARIKYKEELQIQEAKTQKMHERKIIKKEMDILLEAMYELGKVDGMREERLEAEGEENAAYERGLDKGYEEAMKDFRVPDL